MSGGRDFAGAVRGFLMGGRKKHAYACFFRIGADYGARTRHLDLGKVALYQMS